MRNVLKLRISKRTIFSSFVDAAIVAGFIGLVNLPAPTPVEEMGDMESFIQEHIVFVEVTKGDLESGIEIPSDALPVIVTPSQDAERISDRNFGTLSPKWVRGAVQVVREKRCAKQHDAFLADSVIPVLYQQAHAIVESNCGPSAVGKDGELGMYQPLPETCRELGITGDIRKNRLNAKCAEAFLKNVCAQVKKCTIAFMMAAYNRGLRGAKKVKDLHALQYNRKLECAALIIQGGRCT